LPAGVAADRVPQRLLPTAGLGVLVAADLVLAAVTSSRLAFVGAAVWGMHLGLTQGLIPKLVADTSPLDLRGTAFGIFHLVGGGALLLAGALAGTLWSAYGAQAPVLTGAAFALLALGGLLAPIATPRSPRSGT
jgi:MFS family permease